MTAHDLDDDLVEEVARRVARLLRDAGGESAGGLLTAAQVAGRVGVERSWVYAHAEELGVVRIGIGPRPRVRFDPAVLERCVAGVSRRPAASSSSRRRRSRPASVSLLPIVPSTASSRPRTVE